MELKAGTKTSLPPVQERKLTGTHHPDSGTDAWLRGFTSLLVLLFPTVTLFVNRGDSYVFGLLTLVGLYVWLRDGARVWLDRYSGALWIAFLLFFAVAVLSYLLGVQTEDGFHFLGRDLRFLLIAPMYLAFRRYPPTAKTVFIGLALGALVSGVLSTLQFLHAHAPFRMAATTDLSIIFGDLATTMVLCTVAGFALLASSKRFWTWPLLILCLAGGIAATLLSGTRGAWIPLLLLLLALITPFGGFLKGRYVVVIVLVLTAVFASFYLVPSSGIHKRISDVAGSLHNYSVALTYAKRVPPPGSAGRTLCDSNAKFLRAWLDSARLVSGSGNAAVVADSSVGDISGCVGGHAIRLHNQESQSVAQYAFLRLPDGSAKAQRTELMTRGAGTLSFAGGTAVGSINSRAYQAVSIINSASPGKIINVFVAPAETVWLIPMDGYFGEYSLSIANTSVGQRLEMWRAAWIIFLRHPILGAGLGAFRSKVDGLIAKGRVAEFIRDFDHPANEYMNALSSSGIAGFAVLLGILGLPSWLFSRTVGNVDPAKRAVGMAGLLTAAGFAIYALTDTIFLHSMMITWYVIYMALFVALIQDWVTKQENGNA